MNELISTGPHEHHSCRSPLRTSIIAEQDNLKKRCRAESACAKNPEPFCSLLESGSTTQSIIGSIATNPSGLSEASVSHAARSDGRRAFFMARALQKERQKIKATSRDSDTDASPPIKTCARIEAADTPAPVEDLSPPFNPAEASLPWSQQNLQLTPFDEMTGKTSFDAVVANGMIPMKTSDTEPTELWDAVEMGDLQRVDIALRTCDPNSTLDSWTSLHMASRTIRMSVPCVDLLAGRKAQIEALTNTLYTPLAVACAFGRLAIVEALLSLQANPNCVIRTGDTCCHLAAAKDRPSVVEYLLAKFPDCASKRNNIGQTPFDMAHTLEMRRLFPKIGQDSSRKYSRTPFANALRHNARHDMIQKFLAVQSNDPRSEPFVPNMGQRKFVPSERCSKPFATLKKSLLDQVGPDTFQYKSMLGKGAFGEVYHVVHRKTQRSYAMKVLTKSAIFGRNLVRYAMTERNVLSYVRHPFIVSLDFAFQTPVYLVLVLEFCAGGNLAQLIAKQTKLVEPLARLYTAEILLALEHLHEQNIIYRDLKPDNIVLDIRGHALLTDFGLSKEGICGLQSAKSFCGSVAYLAPEMLTRSGHGHTVDLYGLGVLLYEMLTGTPPFWAHEREDLIRNIEHNVLTMPPTFSGSPEAVRLITELMERDPTKRIGKENTKDVRHHAYFGKIDWDAVLKKDFIPLPRLYNRLVQSQLCDPGLRSEMNPLDVYPERENGRRQTIQGWEFVRSP